MTYTAPRKFNVNPSPCPNTLRSQGRILRSHGRIPCHMSEFSRCCVSHMIRVLKIKPEVTNDPCFYTRRRPLNGPEFIQGNNYGTSSHVIMVLLCPCQTSKAVVPLQLDSTGKVKYDAIARMGQRKDKVIHTSLKAMVARDRPTDPELIKPDEEEIEKV